MLESCAMFEKKDDIFGILMILGDFGDFGGNDENFTETMKILSKLINIDYSWLFIQQSSFKYLEYHRMRNPHGSSNKNVKNCISTLIK